MRIIRKSKFKTAVNMLTKFLLAVFCILAISVVVNGQRGKSFSSQFLKQKLRRLGGRRRPKPKICEPSGNNELITPEDFITPEFTERGRIHMMEQVMQNREEYERMQAYINYYDPIDYSSYGYYKNGDYEFGCKDVCVQERQPVLGAYITIEDSVSGLNKSEKCYVVPGQELTFTKCGSKRPSVGVTIGPSYQCMPDNVQEREVVMFCPDVVPQCRTRTFVLPQTCTLNRIVCCRKRDSRPECKSQLLL